MTRMYKGQSSSGFSPLLSQTVIPAYFYVFLHFIMPFGMGGVTSTHLENDGLATSKSQKKADLSFSTLETFRETTQKGVCSETEFPPSKLKIRDSSLCCRIIIMTLADDRRARSEKQRIASGKLQFCHFVERIPTRRVHPSQNQWIITLNSNLLRRCGGRSCSSVPLVENAHLKPFRNRRAVSKSMVGPD